MAEITAKTVAELREKSGAGMMDCKKALTEAGGDIDAAMDYLRKKGIASAAKKAGRAAAQGLVCSMTDDKSGIVLELNSETDFVAQNAEFQTFLAEVSKIALAKKTDLEGTKKEKLASTGKSVEDSLTDMIAKIGENMNLRRMARIEVENGVVVSYVHNEASKGQGKIGVLIALESKADKEKLKELGKQLAMHAAATSPQSLSIEAMDPAVVEKEKEIFREQAKASGKPDNIIDKMIEGRVRKFYEESVFLEQVFVIDGETKVKDVIAKAAKDLGEKIELKAFFRFGLGEGVEKKEVDFAAEVAEQLKK